MMNKLNNLVKLVKKIPKQNDLSYFPNLDRKTKFEILRDNILWLLKYKEANEFYYVYGLDVKGRKINEFLPYNKIQRKRDSLNKPVKQFNYLALLRDKFIFGQFAESLKIPTPKNFFLGDSKSIIKLNELPQGITVECFAKSLTGLAGKDVFPIALNGNQVLYENKSYDYRWLQNRMNDRFIIQEKIIQHTKLNSLYPASVNTIRFLTVNDNGSVKIISAIMRIGANGSSTDNWASGGIIIKINMDDGTLEKEGYFKSVEKGKVERHPDTLVTFKGFVIPFYKESCELVKKLHQLMYGIHTIGWDVAITPNGPLIIEGNDNWDVAMQQLFYKREIHEVLDI